MGRRPFGVAVASNNPTGAGCGLMHKKVGGLITGDFDCRENGTMEGLLVTSPGAGR